MIDRISRHIAGHLWTIAPTVRHRIAPRRAPQAQPWSMVLDDPKLGEVNVAGSYRRHPGADSLVIVVHGLGGHDESAYTVDAAIAADQAGYSCLRLCLRGAGQSGEDIYHAGLTDDLRAAMDHPCFERYEHIFALGYSLGGHVAVRTAVQGAHERLRAVAAVCPPLDLGAVQGWLDAPARKIYREYILRELRAMYAEVARRGRAPTPMERVRQVRTLREWDALTVVPRFGFADVDDYYTTMSVGPRLGELTVPSLLVASRHDPMIPQHTIEPMLAPTPPRLQVQWIDDGGHVFFPPSLDMGRAGPAGLVPQITEWFSQHR